MRYVLVHGALVRDGPWWWAPVMARLAGPSVAVPLPSCGEGGVAPTGAGPGLFDDAAVAAAAVRGPCRSDGRAGRCAPPDVVDP